MTSLEPARSPALEDLVARYSRLIRSAVGRVAGPLSEALGVGLASLSLSHEDSDDSALRSSPGDASGEFSGSSLVLSAGFLSLLPSSENLGTSDDELSDGLASGEGLVSSLVGDAALSVLGESLHGLGNSTDSSASGDTLVASSENGALGSLLVGE